MSSSLQHKLKVIFLRPRRIIQCLKNAALDLKHGRKYLGTPINNYDLTKGYVNTTSTEYNALKEMFSHVSINAEDVLVDIGCGKGRTINWWLSRDIKNPLIGIEVHPEVAEFTRYRLRRYSQVSILTGEAQHQNMLKEGSIFYLFNPFSESLMESFAQALLEKIKKGDFREQRPLIIYHNCLYLHIFENNPIWQIIRLGQVGDYLSAIIVRKGL